MDFLTKSKNLYISSEIKSITAAFSQPLLYCLCVSTKSPFILEILFLRDLKTEFNKNKNYIVIGIALTKKSAVTAVTEIMTPLLADIKIRDATYDLKNIKDTLINKHVVL